MPIRPFSTVLGVGIAAGVLSDVAAKFCGLSIYDANHVAQAVAANTTFLAFVAGAGGSALNVCWKMATSKVEGDWPPKTSDLVRVAKIGAVIGAVTTGVFHAPLDFRSEYQAVSDELTRSDGLRPPPKYEEIRSPVCPNNRNEQFSSTVQHSIPPSTAARYRERLKRIVLGA